MKIQTICMTLILFLLVACGGGTVGTGGQNVVALNRVDGVVTNQSDIPISGVSVSIDGNMGVTVTDSRGSFSLEIENRDALNFDEDTNEVILDISVSTNIDGLLDNFSTRILVAVDAGATLADIQIRVDIPDEILDLIQSIQR